MDPFTFFLAGISFGALALTAFVVQSRRARRLCPDCGTATMRMRGPAVAPSGFDQRWCGGCGWKGASRSGFGSKTPRPGAKRASAFRWSAQPSARAPRFSWAPSDRPSGFHFAPSPDGEPDANAGFQFADSESRGFSFAEADRERPNSPVDAFDWADQGRGGFKWGEGPRS